MEVDLKLNELVEVLTSPYSVAKIQYFFGIRKLEPEGTGSVAVNGNSAQRAVTNSGGEASKRSVFSSSVEQNGDFQGHAAEEKPLSPWRVRLKPSAESHQQHVEYRVDNWLWYWLFRFGALLGDDVFYYTFMPFWFFNVNVIVMRKVSLIWAIVMYVGQASKEILKWPRPKSPPVVPLEPRYFKEYGMPSTHAMVGTLIPFSILFLTMGKVEYSIPMGFLCATSWLLLVCFSRLYKGMHYIMDVVVGVALTFVLLAMIFPFLDFMDKFLTTDPQAPLLLAGIITFLSLTYPSQRGWSSTREDTIVILSATGSIYTSLWLNHHFQWYPDRYNDHLPDRIIWPSLAQCVAMLCRELIGVATTLLAHSIIKPIMLETLSFVYSIEINSETKKWLSVEFPYKYVTYTLVGLICMLVSPFLFSLVGL